VRASRLGVAAAVIATVAVIPAAITPAAQAERGTLADRLVRSVTIEGINHHLTALQAIADRNGGSRDDPSPGLQESFAYVEGQVRAAGFDVSVQEFTYDRRVIDAATVTVGSTTVVPIRMGGSPFTPVGGVTGPLKVVPIDATTGCEVTDYVDAAGSVALIRRGGCPFTIKAKSAAQAGAVAALIYNNSPGPARGDLDPTQVTIPVAGVSGEDGAVLIALAGGSATVDLRDHDEPTLSHNLIAQTRSGRTDNVIVAGAHLDSSPDSPGMNENASGVSAQLELALRMGSHPKVENAVRFAWWGGTGDSAGSDDYLASLTTGQKLDIALYLAVEAIGSSNGGYFVYDGDNSTGTVGPMPYGSGQIEQAFAGYLNGVGIPTEETNIGQARGEYSFFIAEGIPSGGTYTGLQFLKTEAQAAKWGGTAGVAYHQCYDARCDTLGNLNLGILDRNADAIAHVTGVYATSTDDIDGRAQRAAHRTAGAHAVAAPVTRE